MTLYTIQAETHSAITESIRSKTKRSEAILGANIASEIETIPTSAPKLTVPVGVTPEDSNYNGAMLAVKAAVSFWNAKASGTIAFDYQDGYGPIKPTNSDNTGRLSNASGAGIMDCSSYIGLVLRGLDFLSSPYAEITGTNQSYNPQDITAADVSWAEKYFDLQNNPEALTYSAEKYRTADGHYRVISAADQAAYYAKLGLTWWPGEQTIRPGDLCFFYKASSDGSLKYPSRYLGISHVGIMLDESRYLNITDYSSTGNLIVTTTAARMPYLYARPLYGFLTDGSADDLTVGLIDLIPDIWAGIPQGDSTSNGVTLTLSGKDLTLSGTASTGFAKDVISNSCPLFLPPGTYKLSGFINGSGTNTVSATHSMWGFRVYDADTGEGISGTTTSSNGVNTAERTPVWDVGAGAVFTLSKSTSIKIDLWLPGSKDVSTLSATPILTRIA